MKMVIAASVLALTCGAAQAATCTQSGKKSDQEVTYTLTQGNPDAVVASACYSGTDKEKDMSGLVLGGVTGWKLADKTDDGSDYLDGGFDQFGASTWSILNPLGYQSVLVTLKQSDSFAAFLLDAKAVLSGTWWTEGPGKSVGGLSHASVYFAGEPAPAPVPLPAGAALLPAGLAALAIMRRRKKR
ncbi:VPLPA-CTERM sorting domain-containing protein [Paracoccus benzoatiresistens]|uniref:VPLPA-CTERM sorting domain-containing protein n=1 Tax=Paracoccus benzoatiresistens TaxID=2997341 RepID=A0ABT4J003_9RHOB|nr:VPLPA-CTERM sorting domain-containing protein [Paracoccus sp. EF6]MCZ0960219.1 VPLPA-CTERM sorting domain-containing protein [Paracoccus sp. EF6]